MTATRNDIISSSLTLGVVAKKLMQQYENTPTHTSCRGFYFSTSILSGNACLPVDRAAEEIEEIRTEGHE